MSVTAKNLAEAQYAPNSDTTIYTVPGQATTIIDKFTATNTDTGSQTLTVNLIANLDTVGGQNKIISALSIAAGATTDITALQNQILAQGDQISVNGSVASKIVVRVSGREIT